VSNTRGVRNKRRLPVAIIIAAAAEEDDVEELCRNGSACKADDEPIVREEAGALEEAVACDFVEGGIEGKGRR
jgi:hypothetical protein